MAYVEEVTQNAKFGFNRYSGDFSQITEYWNISDFYHYPVLSFFSALHGMAARTSDEKGVCPSVCLSVCLSKARIVTKRKKNQSRFLYHTKDHLT